MCLKSSIDGATHPKCRTRVGLDGFISGVVYKTLVKKIIYNWKYQPFVSDLTGAISTLFYESLIQQENWQNLLSKDSCIVCVPLSFQKLRTRGYNHAELLAKKLAQKASLPFVQGVLIRTRHTKAQFQLGKDARFENVKDAFAINNKMKKVIEGKTIILIDDVATTFATLRSCTAVLKRSGAKEVWGVTFTREQ
jgi:competence protein ComFC